MGLQSLGFSPQILVLPPLGETSGLLVVWEKLGPRGLLLCWKLRASGDQEG